jgi:hypothetical protein
MGRGSDGAVQILHGCDSGKAFGDDYRSAKGARYDGEEPEIESKTYEAERADRRWEMNGREVQAITTTPKHISPAQSDHGPQIPYRT